MRGFVEATRCCMRLSRSRREEDCFLRTSMRIAMVVHSAFLSRICVLTVPSSIVVARRFHSSGSTTSSSNSVSLPSSSGGSILQRYKSSHRGSSTAPEPKPLELQSVPGPTDSSELMGVRSSCTVDAGPVPKRQLTPLQKRQMLLKDKAPFSLTPQAIRRVKHLLAQYNTTHSVSEGGQVNASRPIGIRIGVRRRGCSGYSYTVNYYFPNKADKNFDESLTMTSKKGRASMLADVVVEQDDIKVVVDGDALFYVIGTQMDYVIRSVEEKFIFQNPNQKYSCGCEESFMPLDEDDVDMDD